MCVRTCSLNTCAHVVYVCAFSIYYRTRWGVCNRNGLHAPCAIAVVYIQVSITVIQASLGCKYDIVTLFLRIVIWWQNVMNLIHTYVLRFIVLIVHPRQVLIPGVNKLFDIFDTKIMHLWTELFDLIKKGWFCLFVLSSWFSHVMKSMLPFSIPLMCLLEVSTQQTNKNSNNVATPAHNQYKTIRIWRKTKQ